MSATVTAPPNGLIAGMGRIRKVLDAASRSTVTPNGALLEMAQSAWLTKALDAAVRLGTVDALRDGPLTGADVTHRVGADPGEIPRLMRALASNGVLRLRRDDLFGLTRVGQALRADHEGSMAPMTTVIGSPEHRVPWGDLLHLVATGYTAVEKRRREHTAAERSNLLFQADFRYDWVIPTAGPAAIVEAVPV